MMACGTDSPLSKPTNGGGALCLCPCCTHLVAKVHFAASFGYRRYITVNSTSCFGGGGVTGKARHLILDTNS